MGSAAAMPFAWVLIALPFESVQMVDDVALSLKGFLLVDGVVRPYYEVQMESAAAFGWVLMESGAAMSFEGIRMAGTVVRTFEGVQMVGNEALPFEGVLKVDETVLFEEVFLIAHVWIPTNSYVTVCQSLHHTQLSQTPLLQIPAMQE